MGAGVRGGRGDPPPLDRERLERMAINYVGRYSTTRAKLRTYLDRKLRERGWAGEGLPDPAALAERLAEIGYIDDAAFAAARGASLTRRGYGASRVGLALRAAGIEEQDARPVKATAGREAWTAALAFARRRRIGPFAREAGDRDDQRRWIAAMLRAGHRSDFARLLASALPGEEPDTPDAEYLVEDG
ncbi:RecX family transcriptional regulator [Sphingomonas sp. ID0503]|uniref:RecX family transcriptional regulator n=1 Tax=Sphingomonas sp. ID0503 TaxID=3399691 RepID=UPI003AFAAB88